MKFQRRHWLGNFAINCGGTRDTEIEVILQCEFLSVYLSSVVRALFTYGLYPTFKSDSSASLKAMQRISHPYFLQSTDIIFISESLFMSEDLE
jgi:hypothetical protein